MFAEVFAPVLGILIMLYGVAWMIGGSRQAARFARWIGRGVSHFICILGRTMGRVILRYPRVTGVLILVVLLSMM